MGEMPVRKTPTKMDPMTTNEMAQRMSEMGMEIMCGLCVNGGIGAGLVLCVGGELGWVGGLGTCRCARDIGNQFPANLQVVCVGIVIIEVRASPNGIFGLFA